MPGRLQHGQRMHQFIAVTFSKVLPQLFLGATSGHYLGPQLHIDTPGAGEEIRLHLDHGRQGTQGGPRRKIFRHPAVQIPLQNQTVGTDRRVENIPAPRNRRTHCHAPNLG